MQDEKEKKILLENGGGNTTYYMRIQITDFNEQYETIL
jgi:hypothetical protein